MKIRIWIKTVKLHQVRSEMIPIQITVLRKIYCTEICRYGKASNGYCAEMDLLKERSLEFVWEYGLEGVLNVDIISTKKCQYVVSGPNKFS